MHSSPDVRCAQTCAARALVAAMQPNRAVAKACHSLPLQVQQDSEGRESALPQAAVAAASAQQ